ncbi:formylglycine-generating enzyme family protein [Mailhella sp.]|uniref:formylglycine-generating enzyme family protein n=1 Tax=Mailhella sp. TaxID=1981029 RepID=UPI004063DE18
MSKLILVLCIALLWASPSEAAITFKPKSAMLNAAQVSEPHPAPGDVVLPMPGGLEMTLRPVCIPGCGYLDATDIQQGVQIASSAGVATDGNGDRGQYAEQRHTLSISAPFEPDNIPPVWGKGIVEFLQSDKVYSEARNSGITPYVYFIGKYEISRAQWRAVMEPPAEGAPFKFEADDYLPMTKISWFDVLEFTRRYSEWLMQNHPEALPYFAQEQRSSFIRLPSEAEWEFAARGGHKVSPAERSQTSLHPIPEGEDYREYITAQLYDASLHGLSPIGARKANPLGLYDMLGNCSEMILSPFRLVAGGKQIGSYGGFVMKGGSWRSTTQEELHPGHRVEAAYYVDGKAQVRDDMGFRVVLGSILTPRERRDSLFEEWKSRTAPKAAQATEKDDVRTVIRHITTFVEDPALKQRLAQAEATASLYHEKVNESEERMIRETLVGALFSLETIANYGSRGYQLASLLDAYGNLAKKDSVEHNAEKVKMEKDIRGFTEGIQSALFYYLSMLKECRRFEQSRIMPQLKKVSLQFAHDDGFSRSMTRRVRVLEKHLNSDVQMLDEKSALRDILPDWLLKKLNTYW